jgi:AFG1-like ATPase
MPLIARLTVVVDARE